MKKYFAPFALLLLSIAPQWVSAQGQLLPFMAQFRENSFLLNPAFPPSPVKEEENFRARNRARSYLGLNFRGQWFGGGYGDNAPRTISARYQQRVSTAQGNTFWLGGFAMFDRTGPNSIGKIAISPSYQINLGNSHYLSAGLSLNITRFELDAAQLKPADFNDALLWQAAANNETSVNGGMGVFFANKGFYLGLSAPQVIMMRANREVRDLFHHYYANVGFYLPTGRFDPFDYIEPYAWVRYAKNNPVNVDINIKAQFEKPLWILVGYNSAAMLKAGVGMTGQPTRRGGRRRRGRDTKFELGFLYNYAMASELSLGHSLELSVALIK